MIEILSALLVGACLWATVDIIQSQRSTQERIILIALIWIFSAIAVPIYFLIIRKPNQNKPKFGSSAWGSIIGLMFGGPLGAIAGAYLGHSLEGGKQKIDDRSIFQIHLISLLSYIIKVDGEISQVEIQTTLRLFQRLGFSSYDIKMMARAFEKALREDIDLKSTCDHFRTYSSYEERIMLLRMIYMIVIADQKFHSKEKEAVLLIVEYLGIRNDDHLSIQAEFFTHTSQNNASPENSDQNYDILGLKRGATLREVKKKYRKLALTHHPDRVGHLGEEYQKIAEEKFKKINEAYHIIIKEIAAAK